MDYAFTATQAWAVVLGLGIPFIVLWWWARRHAPLSGDQRDYSVGYRLAEPEPAAHAAGHTTVPHAPVAMPEGMVDAPVVANPAHLEPPTAVAAPPASIAAQPLPTAALPPEPAGAVPHPAPPPVAVVTTPATPAAKPPAVTIAAAPPPSVHAAPVAAAPTPAPAPKAEAKVEAPTPPPAAKAPPAPQAPKAPPPVKAAAPPTPPPAPTAQARPEPAAPPPLAATPPPPAAPPKPVAAAAPAAPKAPAAAPAAPPPAPAAVTPAPTGDGDDLSKILNVTPQIVGILNGAGIQTYRELAAADPNHLRELLEDAGLGSVDPSTWPQQGRFAAGGKWKQLQNLQSRLAAG
jgi:predicted flap endonuclease-1-like 5' DNA nuclease